VTEKYRTTQEVADHFRVPAATVRYWKHVGKLKGIRPGRRTLYAVSEIERFEHELRDDGGEAA
jgi:hypothetical protein